LFEQSYGRHFTRSTLASKSATSAQSCRYAARSSSGSLLKAMSLSNGWERLIIGQPAG
jgi:hypothetical protein